jgi:PIN domain nuclease of toxin-antitoxin system
LSNTARQAILAATTVCVSAASAWELAIKRRTGKLGDLADVVDKYAVLMVRSRFEALPVSAAHGLHLAKQSARHRDPFDRLLAAQAELEGLVLVTRDPAFAQFPVQTLW